MMVTQVDRPYLRSHARPSSASTRTGARTRSWNIQNRLIFSDIDEGAVGSPDWGRDGQGRRLHHHRRLRDGRTAGASSCWACTSATTCRSTTSASSRAPNLNYAHYEVKKRITDMPKESTYSSHDWRWRISGTDNDSRPGPAAPVPHERVEPAQGRRQRLRADQHQQRRPRRPHPARQRHPAHAGELQRLRRDAAGRARATGRSTATSASTTAASATPTTNATSAGTRSSGPRTSSTTTCSLYTTLYAERTPQWMLWQGGNLIGTFDEHAQQLDVGVNWNIGDNQELRVKMQALGLDADLRQAWRVAPNGTPVRDQRSDRRFQPQQPGLPGALPLGVQAAVVPVRRVRPRRRPVQRVHGGSTRDALTDAFSLRDDEQLVVKLSYRFEL